MIVEYNKHYYNTKHTNCSIGSSPTTTNLNHDYHPTDKHVLLSCLFYNKWFCSYTVHAQTNNFSYLTVRWLCGIHFIYTYNHLLHSKSVSKESVLSCLSVLSDPSLKFSSTRCHNQHSTVSLSMKVETNNMCKMDMCRLPIT